MALEQIDTPEGLLSEARQKYLFNAEFHAQVEMVVRVLNDDFRAVTGKSHMGHVDQTLATLAASVMLVLANREQERLRIA